MDNLSGEEIESNMQRKRRQAPVHPSFHLKSIRNDVFRQPPYPRIFSVLIGFGLQFAISLLATSLFLMIFFKTKQHRSKVILSLLAFYLFTGLILGYSTSKFYMSINVHIS